MNEGNDDEEARRQEEESSRRQERAPRQGRSEPAEREPSRKFGKSLWNSD
jgi:hypothetical protein